MKRNLFFALLLAQLASASNIYTSPLKFVILDPSGACTNPGYNTQNIVTGLQMACIGGTWTGITAGSVTFPGVTDNILAKFASGSAVNSSFLDGTNLLESPTTTQTLTYQGGKDASTNSELGSVIVRGANQTAGAGGTSSVAGGVLISGGDDAITNAASVAGTVQIEAGEPTGASPNTGLPGLLLSTESYFVSGTVTQWFLQCPTASAMTVTNCAASPPVVVGVAMHASAVAVDVAVQESEIPIAADAAVTVGHTVCAGATAGKVTDSGGTLPCTTGRTIGHVIAITGTWPTFPDGTAFPTLSSTLPLVKIGRYITQVKINGQNCTPGSSTGCNVNDSNAANTVALNEGIGNAIGATAADTNPTHSLYAKASGDPAFRATTTADLPAAANIKPCEIIIGDPGAASPALADDNDSPVVCGNVYGQDYTITAVACWANAGSPTVTPILTGGAATSILSGALTCGTAGWAFGTINGTPTVHSFSADGATCSSTPCTLDANITTAGGTAKYIVIRFTRTL